MAIYDVKTEKFGTVMVERNSIKDARRWAKEAHGVGPRCVTPHAEQKPVCDACECRPCACPVT